MKTVDATVSAFGKPYQTAAAILSLLEHSGQHIGTVYLQEEPEHPHGDSVARILPWLRPHRIVHYVPPLFLGADAVDRKRIFEETYRLSIRYQFAWEKTDKDFLFIFHSDCFFSGDIVGKMLRRLQDQPFAGVGQIGQCWNCPAHSAGACGGDSYESYRPSHADAVELFARHPPNRAGIEFVDRASPMPLPECRLNEFACLINVGMVWHEVVPHGDIVPFGTMGLDIGVDWFRQMVLRGHRFLNFYDGMEHGFFNDRQGGFQAGTDAAVYRRAEANAKEFLMRTRPHIFAPE